MRRGGVGRGESNDWAAEQARRDAVYAREREEAERDAWEAARIAGDAERKATRAREHDEAIAAVTALTPAEHLARAIRIYTAANPDSSRRTEVLTHAQVELGMAQVKALLAATNQEDRRELG